MSFEVRDAYVDARQLLLFGDTPRQVARERGWAWPAVLWLHGRGFLSFDPERKGPLDEREYRELLFLGALLAAGCDEPMLERVLEGLERPLSYDVSKMYFDWLSRSWKMIPVLEPVDPHQIFQEWVDELAGDENVVALRELIGELETAVAEIPGG